MMMEINHLPSEMLLEVHRRLSPSSLKKAVLVSKLWRDVGQDPALWEWCKVAVYSKEDIDNLSIKRLKQIKEIYINPDNWDAQDWEAFFRAVEAFSSLKTIDGLGRVGSGLDLVEPGLFARSLAKLEDVDVDGCTYDQIEALFKEMSSSTQVKTFHLWSHDLSQMEPGLFARVLSRLENLQLAVGNVTQDQMKAFFTEILNGSLKKLDLIGMGDICRLLEPGLFARALSKVEDVSLPHDYGGVASDHLEALFTEMSFGTQLKRLRLSSSDLDQIEAALLANALSRLEGVSLKCSLISTDQIQALFTEISLRTQMKNIAFTRVDLSQLDPGLFARVMASLEDVDLHDTDITSDQMLEFFTEISHSSRLKRLNIHSVDLRDVDPEVFAKAVAGLETVILCATDITNDQVMSLFSEMSRNTVMKKIDIGWDDLSSADPEVLVRALIRLDEVRLCGTGITNDQATAFFQEMSQNTQLKKLSFSEDNLSTVDPAVFATALTNVKEVCISDSNLSLEQINSIFTGMLEGEKKLRKLFLRGIGGAAAEVNTEIVRKVKEKLKDKFFFQSKFFFQD